MACIAVRVVRIQPRTRQATVPQQQHGECRLHSVRVRGCFTESVFCASAWSRKALLERRSLIAGCQKKSERSSVVAFAAATLVSSDCRDAKKTSTFRISETFAELKKKNRVAFIPYLTAGDPNLETTAAAVKLLEQCGADIIELGIPYSDPLADGPVIQAAGTRAISGGTTLDSVLTLIREGLSDVKTPIVVFVYYNPLLRRGLRKFLEEAKAAGASGLVVPDLPLEETRKLSKLTHAAGLELVLLTTPTTPTVRMKAIAEASQGFMYLVSLTGVTGARSSIEGRVENLLKDIKKETDKPVAVGFGVSRPEHAAKLAEWGADGVIIGSKIVKLLGESESPEEGLKAVEDFAIEVRAALS